MEELVTELDSWFSSQTITTCEIDDPVGGVGVDKGVAAGVALGVALGADTGDAVAAEVAVAVAAEVAVAVGVALGVAVAPDPGGETITARLANVVGAAAQVFGEPVGERGSSSRGGTDGLAGPFNHLAASLCKPKRTESGTETRALKEPSSSVRSKGMPVLLPSQVS